MRRSIRRYLFQFASGSTSSSRPLGFKIAKFLAPRGEADSPPSRYWPCDLLFYPGPTAHQFTRAAELMQ